MKTEKQIEGVIQEATDNDGKFHGQTYEQGVLNALEWVLEGDEDSISPMSD